MIQVLAEEHPVTSLCSALNLAPSAYYCQAQKAQDEAQLKTYIQSLAGRWPTYGYRRITVQLRRDYQVTVNSKRVRRLMRELGIQGERPCRKQRTTNSDHAFPRYPNLVQNLTVDHPEQVWVGDITYVRLAQGFVYLAVLMDVFTRSIRGWHLGRSLEQTCKPLIRGMVISRTIRSGLSPARASASRADAISTTSKPAWRSIARMRCRAVRESSTCSTFGRCGDVG